MPQMAPLSWMTLYLYFTILFIFMCIMNFYLFLYSPSYKNNSLSKIKFSWKW